MIINSNYNENNKKKLYRDELVAMGHRLKQWVEYYRKHLLYTKDEERKTLDELEELSKLLIEERFDQLMDDTSIIDYESRISEILLYDLPF